MTVHNNIELTNQVSRIPTWIPLLAFILLILLIGGVRYAIFEQYKKSITEKEVQNLGGIADLKVAQIVAWREAHRRRAEMFLQGSLLPNEVAQWLHEGAPANERKQRILKVLAGIQRVQIYKTVSLLDKEGAARISTNDAYIVDAEEEKLAVAAMRSQSVLFSDLHRGGREGNKITIDCVAPLLATDVNKGVYLVGALLFEIDPDSFLYPMIQSWPTPSPSAETLLVRQDDGHILFLNEVRHIKGAALSLRIPLANAQLPAARALIGLADVAEGLDYRGVPVVAALRSVPGTPWFMVAKVDKDELFAPINQLKKWTAGLGLAFVVLGGGLFFVWFRGHQARYQQLKTLHDAALEREMLLKHFEYLTRYANDMIIVANEAGQVVEANERAQQALGYSWEELLHKHVVELHGPLDSPAILGNLEMLKREGELRVEGFLQRKDGTSFPVEVSARVIEVQGVKYVQGILRDITERKRTEAELRESEARFRNMADTALALIWLSDTENLGVWFSKGWLEYTGRTMEQELGLGWVAGVHPDDLSWCMPYCNEAFSARRRFEIEFRLRRADGSYGWIADTGIPRFTPDGEFEGYIGYCWDITERKLAEERLGESYKELEKLTTHLEAVREDEQKRIARELHDEMGGVLAALDMKVSLMAAHPPTEIGNLMTEVADLEKLVAAGIQAMRRTVSELRPSLLDEVGLAFAIERYVQEFERNTEIECDLRLPEEELTLDGNQSSAIFRIIQESLTNVAKHAKASRVGIVLSEWEKSLVLTVKDNGKGFDLNTQKAKSFGLLGIRERAAMVGGKAQITSEEGKGTTVRVSLPLTASRPEGGPTN